MEKLRALGWLFRAYDRTTDLGVAVLMLIAAGLLLHGRDRIATWGRATLFATVLGLLYFAFPSQTIGTWAADRRFLYPAAIVAVLSVRLEVSRQAARIALSLVVLVLLARSVYVHRSWSWLDARIEAQRQLLREVAPGSRIFAVSSDALWTDLYGMAFPHVVAYAAISSHAVVPLFADPTQQPLVARDAAVSASSSGPETASSTTIEESEWTNIISAYQYVWVNGATAADRTMLSRHCSAIAEAEGALLASACHVDAR